MAVVRTYQLSPDACVAASILESEGIEATVVDDSKFGGNAFGALPASIRIEVAEPDLERARAILEASEQATPQEIGADLEETSPDSGLVGLFRLVVVAELALIVFGSAMSGLLFHEQPQAVAAWIAHLPHSVLLTEVILELWWLRLLATVLASCFLMTFISAGRPLYLAIIVWDLFATAVMPPEFQTPLGRLYGGIGWMLAGGIVFLMFLPQLSARFRGTVGARASDLGSGSP